MLSSVNEKNEPLHKLLRGVVVCGQITNQISEIQIFSQYFLLLWSTKTCLMNNIITKSHGHSNIAASTLQVFSMLPYNHHLNFAKNSWYLKFLQLMKCLRSAFYFNLS